VSKPVDPVDLVELRIERRRDQLQRHWAEAREHVARKNRWTPLVAVAAMAALGVGLSRAATSPPPLRAARGTTARERGIFGALAATLLSGVRFATSPTGRALWASFNQARQARRRTYP